MNLQLLRHATVLLRYAGRAILVDPMLSRAGAMEPVANAADSRRIPLVELPIGDDELGQVIGQTDAVLITHTHRDHWDSRAVELLPRNIPLLCQPADVERFTSDGFAAIRPVESEIEWEGIRFSRTGGQHGTGEIGQRMGQVSGFVLRAGGEPRLYLAGDTVWCPEVVDALSRYQPDVIVANAGAARFLVGGPITMTAEDVANVCRARPEARIIAVHMEAINHCQLTRADLRAALERAGCAAQVMIPADGEMITL